MQINLNKLEQLGVSTHYDEKEKTITFTPTGVNSQANRALKRLGETLNFNGTQTDELWTAVYSISILGALRACSGL